MRKLGVILIAAMALGLRTTLAQPASSSPPAGQARLFSGLESVTVTAAKPSEATIKSFVETRAAPTYVLGRMARWMTKVCPLTVGLGDKYAKFVSQRIRDIASTVGVPVNSDPACRPNIEIVFTTTPQGLMDQVRHKQPLLLGYYSNLHQADELARVNHSIQAWYTTVSQDMDGSRQIDVGRCGPSGGGTLNTMTDATTEAGGAATAGVYQLDLPCAVVMHVTGSRARDGLSSGFFNVLIVAEPAKLLDHEVGSLADYVAMLALSQPASLDSCQELPSISNLLAPGCTSASGRITDGDLAFLKAFYKLPEGNFLAAQRNYVRYEMAKTMMPDTGGQK
jgi:hypothetical protein